MFRIGNPCPPSGRVNGDDPTFSDLGQANTAAWAESKRVSNVVAVWESDNRQPLALYLDGVEYRRVP